MQDKLSFEKIDFGGGAYPFEVIAGPCSAETEAQVLETASALKSSGIDYLRVGLWKPRTRPGGFEGMGRQAIPWLVRVREEIGMTVTTEVATQEHVQTLLEAGFNTFWIGARTTSSPFAMQEIAEALSGEDVTVLVKNPLNPDIELWEGALSRLLDAGIPKVGAIHRGFSTYGEKHYRNEPIWQIPIELRRRHPNVTILLDPSHIAGKRAYIESLLIMGMELQYDGFIVETHPEPDKAWTDAAQQITPAELVEMLGRLHAYSESNSTNVHLDALRRSIDQIDQSLLELLARRMTLSREIGKYKNHDNLSLYQPERYREIQQSRGENGRSLGLDQDFIHELYSLIHEESIRIQKFS